MENLTGYVEARIELMKYELKEDLAKVLSKLSVFIGLAILAMFFLFFVSIAISIEIGRHIGYFGGFAIVSLIYVIAALILFANREKLIESIELKIKEVIKQKKK